MPHEYSPGVQLGPYLLGERLGVGGMAEVYLAWRSTAAGARRFALKRILPQLARDSRFVAMFCDEARISAMLLHPNIVRVEDFGEDEGELFMAMEYVDGVSVARLLRAVSARKREVPLGLVLYVAMEVLSALVCAHEAVDEDGRRLHIVHRDVSPGNVLLSRAGHVKLTDFGILRSAFVERRTYPGELKGKLGYMSPEQVMGEELDTRSDIFTLGIVLAELALLRPLFHGRSEFEVLTRTHNADLSMMDEHGQHLPPALSKILRRALAVKPMERYRTAREFLADVEALVNQGVESFDAPKLSEWLKELGILPKPAPPAQSGTRRLDTTQGEGAAGRSEARPARQSGTMPAVGSEEVDDGSDEAPTLRERRSR